MSRKSVTFDHNPLFGGPSLAERARSGSPFRYLTISDIDVDPEQPRRVFDDESIGELASSIQEFGVLCPILVQVTPGGTYRLISGERRLRAARSIGLTTIPAVIDSDDEEGSSVLGKQLVENLQREDLSAMERALAIGHLREKFGLSVREIAKKLGISKSLVQRSLEILSLPEDLQAALIAGAPESKVLLLARVEEVEVRKQLAGKLDNYTRAQLEQLLKEGRDVESLSHGGTARKAEKAKLSVEDQRIVNDLQKALGTKVQLTRKKGEPSNGRITLEFYSEEDLTEIYERLTKI